MESKVSSRAAPPGIFSIIDPDDPGTVADVVAAVEQLAASLVPGPIMPTLLASLLGVKAHPAAVALTPGTLTADHILHVTGETGPVLGASANTTLLLSVGDGTWFTVDPAQSGVTVTPLTPLDFSRDLANVRLDNVAVTPIDGLDTAQVHDLAATLFAAEAAGVAAWCSSTATEYAKIRKQFGRLIGEFQAVKHLCATMYCRAERAAAMVWDAPQVAVDAVENAKDCIQVLGGIGFTWEHDAHLYLRRALTLRQLLPALDRPPRDVPATSTASIRSWALAAVTGHGTQEQRDRFTDPEITWCQLFSEPEAGSDLAGLRTRAIEVDGGWRLTGQKVWTSLAREADWAICLARTDPAAPKHKGLSFFLVDMRSDGIDIRPLREITGRAVFNEVFLDDVFVADHCLVGAPGDGWRVAMTTLGTEREALGGDDQLAKRGAHPAVRKLLGVQQRQAAAEQALAALGPAGAAATEESEEFLLTRCLSIAGGTTQILLNQVAERILGLPRG
jgi:alkylation response protein AidB-like acyl-CoA dehydrogenase